MKTRATRSRKKRTAKPTRKSVKRKAKVDIRIDNKAAAKKNKTAHWSTYKNLQKKAEKALGKLRSDVKKKANPNVLLKDKNALLFLLGECNYMARQCMRAASTKKKSSKKRS